MLRKISLKKNKSSSNDSGYSSANSEHEIVNVEKEDIDKPDNLVDSPWDDTYKNKEKRSLVPKSLPMEIFGYLQEETDRRIFKS